MLKICVSTSDGRFSQVNPSEWVDFGVDGSGIDLVPDSDVELYMIENPDVGIVKVEFED